jgi:hypothetical protein
MTRSISISINRNRLVAANDEAAQQNLSQRKDNPMVAQLATTEDDSETEARCANPECRRPFTAFPASLAGGYCWQCRVAREMDEWRARAKVAILALTPADRMVWEEGVTA